MDATDRTTATTPAATPTPSTDPILNATQALKIMRFRLETELLRCQGSPFDEFALGRTIEALKAYDTTVDTLHRAMWELHEETRQELEAKQRSLLETNEELVLAFALIRGLRGRIWHTWTEAGDGKALIDQFASWLRKERGRELF